METFWLSLPLLAIGFVVGIARQSAASSDFHSGHQFRCRTSSGGIPGGCAADAALDDLPSHRIYHRAVGRFWPLCTLSSPSSLATIYGFLLALARVSGVVVFVPIPGFLRRSRREQGGSVSSVDHGLIPSVAHAGGGRWACVGRWAAARSHRRGNIFRTDSGACYNVSAGRGAAGSPSAGVAGWILLRIHGRSHNASRYDHAPAHGAASGGHPVLCLRLRPPGARGSGEESGIGAWACLLTRRARR